MKPNYHAVRPIGLNASHTGVQLMPMGASIPVMSPAEARAMKGKRIVMKLSPGLPSGERFAVIEFDGTLGPGGIPVAVICHPPFHTQAEAEHFIQYGKGAGNA